MTFHHCSLCLTILSVSHARHLLHFLLSVQAMLHTKGATDFPHPSTSASSQVSILLTFPADTTGQSTTTRQSSVPKKRQNSESNHTRKQSGRKKTKTSDTTVAFASTFASTTATVELKPGCEGAPIEVWHHILSYLLTSQVARVSLTSKTLSEICRS